MAAWKHAYFTPEQLADGTSDDAAAPLADGWGNLLKYAFAMQPFDLPSAWLPQTTLEDGHLTLSYHRPLYIGDLSYAVEVADAVVGPWQTGPEQIEQVSVTNNYDWTETIKVRDRATAAEHAQRFIRLRVTRTTRATDGDGLDDDEELRYFGNLLQTAGGDFDGDGISNLDEIQNHTDPADYYNGQTPILLIVSGDGQRGAAGQNLPQALVVSVADAHGVPLVNAPVAFTLLQGDSFLSTPLPRTGADGTASVQYQLPPSVQGSSIIRASAGKITPTPSVQFTAEIETPPTPPTDVRVVRNPDGSIDMTWVNQGTNTQGFKIEFWNSTTKQYDVIGIVATERTAVHINPDGTLTP